MPVYTVTCRACGTANRIPVEREGQAGRCGECRAALLPFHVRRTPGGGDIGVVPAKEMKGGRWPA